MFKSFHKELVDSFISSAIHLKCQLLITLKKNINILNRVLEVISNSSIVPKRQTSNKSNRLCNITKLK